MKCPECVKLGMKSIVTPGGGRCTAKYCAPFYDEDGNYHQHDVNTTTRNYSCSKGHKWQKKERDPCPHANCDWNELPNR